MNLAVLAAMFEHEVDEFEVDSLDVMIKFIPIWESKNHKSAYNKLKSFLCQRIKRGITKEEEVNLLQGIGNYINSKPATQERTEAMKYLFNLKFLSNESH